MSDPSVTSDGFGFALENLNLAIEEMGIDDPSEITLKWPYTDWMEDIVVRMAESWEENLGIKVETMEVDMMQNPSLAGDTWNIEEWYRVELNFYSCQRASFNFDPTS